MVRSSFKFCRCGVRADSCFSVLFSLNWAGLGHTPITAAVPCVSIYKKDSSEKIGNSRHKHGTVYLESCLSFLT